MRRVSGFTVVDLLAVLVILGVIFGLVFLVPDWTPPPSYGTRMECMNNVKNLVGLLEAIGRGEYPEHAGANLVLYLVVKGGMEGPDELSLLFCPGDERESLDPAAYVDLDLTRSNGHLTSYAGRDQKDRACRVPGRDAPPVVLVCDDSEDHHEGGYVVGLSNGAARWRDETPGFELGPDSAIEELRCLRAD